MIKNKKQFLLLLLVFTFSITYLMFYVYKIKHTLYVSSPDGKLYLSIADNFIKNGHFIQTARPNDINFVVPPGLPIILTVFKLIYDNVIFIVLFQYIIFGLNNVIIFLSCRNLFNNYFSGCISVIIYSVILSSRLECTPSYTLTETYTLFLISLVLFILSVNNYSWEKRLSLIIPVLFIGCLIRPLLIPFWIFSMLAMIIMLLNKKFNLKKAILLITLPLILLAINIFINYRETGDIILLENYSSIGFYQANNINAKALKYGYTNEFVDDYFIQVYNDSNLTITEKNSLLKEKTKNFMIHNLKFVLKNAAIKYYYLFIEYYKYAFFVFIIGLLYFSIYEKNKRIIYLLFLMGFIYLSIITSLGLYVIRYSIVILPFYSIIIAGFFETIVSYLYKHVKMKKSFNI